MGVGAAAGGCAAPGGCVLPGAAAAADAVGAVGTGVSWAAGCALGVLPHAANSAGTAMLANRFDQLLTDFHLAVAAWIELRQRVEALLYPFVVISVLRSRSVHLM